MNLKNSIVLKPWGFEYVIFSYKKIGITFLKIDPKKETSLHCHSEKKTGFVILNGSASIQVGIYKKNTLNYKPLSRLVFRPGLFHKILNKSNKSLYLLEFETPFKKNDLIRMADKFGRKDKDYEGNNKIQKLTKDFLLFKNPKEGTMNKYKFKNIKILIKSIVKPSSLRITDSKSSTAILDGFLYDNKNRKVIGTGEIVKSQTLKILMKNYKIKNKLLIMQLLHY